MVHDGVGRAVVYESTLSRKCQRGHVYSPVFVNPFPIRTLRLRALPTNASFHLHLAAHPLSPSAWNFIHKLFSVRYRLMGRDYIFRFVFAADQFDRQQIYRLQECSISCLTSGIDHWNSFESNIEFLNLDFVKIVRRISYYTLKLFMVRYLNRHIKNCNLYFNFIH